MKKSTCIAASVFNFLFAAVMLALAAFLLRRFAVNLYTVWDFGAETWLLLIIFFFIFAILLIAVLLPLIVALVAAVIAGLNIAAGIMVIKGAKNANAKNVRVFSLMSLIINTVYTSIAGLTIRSSVMNFGSGGAIGVATDILYLAAFMLSLISVILNTVCYGDAKQIKTK